MYDELKKQIGKGAFLYFPEIGNGTFVVTDEGTGDNLLDSDIEDGGLDYINWTSYTADVGSGEPEFTEIDGGMHIFSDYLHNLSGKTIAEGLLEEMREPLDSVFIVLKA